MRAKQSEMSYNLHNQDMKWTRLGCTDTPEVLLKKSKARSGNRNPSFGKRGELSPNWGRKNPMKPETKAKLSAALKGKAGWNKGMKTSPLTDKHRAKLSASLKGRVSPNKGNICPNVAEANKKRAGEKRPAQSLALLGKTWTHAKKVCPHCKTIGAGGNMLRFHFENCKHKGNEHGIA
jgi:hypothetical protein